MIQCARLYKNIRPFATYVANWLYRPTICRIILLACCLHVNPNRSGLCLWRTVSFGLVLLKLIIGYDYIPQRSLSPEWQENKTHHPTHLLITASSTQLCDYRLPVIACIMHLIIIGNFQNLHGMRELANTV